MNNITIRHAEPSDYQPIISVMNDWWGGRNMSDILRKLFFVHFRETNFVAESEGKIVGFLIVFCLKRFQIKPISTLLAFILIIEGED